MSKTHFEETMEFLDGIIWQLNEDGRYEEFYTDPKNIKEINMLRKGANMIFDSMPDLK